MTGLHERIGSLPPDKRAELERRLWHTPARTGAATRPITPRPHPDQPCPLSFAQQRIWFMAQVRPPFNPPSVVEISGKLDVSALRAALNELVARHEVLRTVVEVHDGTPRQRVQPAAEVALPVRDLDDRPAAAQEQVVVETAEAETRRRFDLGNDLMLRCHLLRLAPRNHVLLLTVHHFAADAWARGILMRELGALYEAFAAGRPFPLAPLPIQYADFARWQREVLTGEELERLLAYWRDALGDSPPRLQLPATRSRPPGQALAGSSYDLTLPPALRRQVKALADRSRATVFMVLLAAVNTLLHRHTGQEDLVLGSTIANRGRPETEGLIGCFVNTIAVRTDLSGDPTFRALLDQVRRHTLDAYEHQDLPFETLVQRLKPERDDGHAPIVQMVVNYDNTPKRTLEFPGLRLRVRPVHMDVVHFDLTLTITPTPGDGLLCTWEYNADMFDADTIEALAQRWYALLTQVVADPDRPVSEVELLTAADRRALAQWNRTSAPVPAATVCQLFEAQATRTPHAAAVTCGATTLTYAQLNARSNQLAHHLRERGLGPRALVGVCVDRSPELVVAILGILKAGAAFVPLDPGYPTERLELMVSDADLAAVLTPPHLVDRLPSYQRRRVLLSPGSPDLARQPDTDPHPVAGAADLAYVIYTSGSTGRPKGVQVEHRSLTNYALAAVGAFDLTGRDRFLQFAALGFDVLVEELFPTLLAGATVVLVPGHALNAAPEFAALLAEQRITVIELPTAFWHEWVRVLPQQSTGLPDSLRLVIVGGERILPDRLVSWQRTGVPLTHVFGLTETTITTTTFRVPAQVDPEVADNLPVGRPLANMRVYVLDRHRRPVPVGVPGELYIGGVGVARGYLNRPELTAERFLPDPFTTDPPARMYRTGDLVRWRHTGDLEFIGRIDNQVKIRGFRVEPAEVEAALARHPDLREVAVVAREDTPGQRRLVAYVVPAPQRRPEAAALRGFLADQLPAHLVPSRFVPLDALPVTAHGKVDRAALPAPTERRPQPAGRLAVPGTPAEVTLTRIWAEVIGVEQVGVDDNFFEIGGDSILSIQIVARAHAAGLRLSPTDLFRYPTVRRLAQHATASAGPAAPAGPASGPFPLTPIQQWFFAQRLPHPEHWNMATMLRVRADYGEGVLRQALDALLDHHDGLRQRFATGADATVQGEVAETAGGCPFEVVDLRATPPHGRAAAIEAHATRIQSGLDLRDGPLVRAALFHCGDAEPPRLLVVAHHLLMDAVSWRILLSDLELACAQLHAGQAVALPPTTTAFAVWAEQQAARAAATDLETQLPYWRAVADGARRLPVDFPDARAHNLVADADQVTVTVPADLTDALLRELPAAYHTQINDVLLAALAEALRRWDGDPVHVVDLESHGRHEAAQDLSRTVGWFTAIYPVRLEARASDRVPDVIKRTKQWLREVPAGGADYLALRQRGLVAAEVAAEVAFSYFGQFDQLLPDDGPFTAAAEPVGHSQHPAGHRPHLIDISGQIRAGCLHLACRYGRRVHHRERIQELAEAYRAALTDLITYHRGAPDIGYTPSDFPSARLSQSDLDSFLARLSGPGAQR